MQEIAPQTRGEGVSTYARPPKSSSVDHFKPQVCRQFHPGLPFDTFLRGNKWTPVHRKFDVPLFSHGMKRCPDRNNPGSSNRDPVLSAMMVFRVLWPRRQTKRPWRVKRRENGAVARKSEGDYHTKRALAASQCNCHGILSS